jgi:glutathione S-transferase
MTELGQNLLQTLYHGLDTPFSYKPEDRSKAAADYSLSQLNRCLGVLDGRLEGRDHLLGDFTLVDVAAASWLGFGTMFGVKLDAYPRTAAWFQRCRSRPALQRAR